MKLSGKKFLLTTMGALFFAACGDSSTETIVEKGAADIVDEVADLPKCDKSHEGEQIFVKDDAAMRICSDGKWYATMGSAGAGAADTIFVSKSDTVYVSSIDTVLVAGRDTVYVSGGDTIRISVTNTDTIYVVNKDTVYLSVGDGVGGGNIVLDSEQVAVSLDSVKGASQKGPFLSGSKVLVKELRDGRSLTQTGNNFDGKILNDKGEFRITARMLVSQYVMLEANGYYRNEVTGENSNSPLTLFGITDVTGRDIVNINLLTHLEYERVYYLVTKEGYTVKKAKKKAQQEIFDILHIDNSDFSNSEDLSIAGSSDEDGALLAFSILFQGDRSVSQLTELLTRVSTAMEKEGKWEDATAKAEIADWAMAADTSDRLADIRGKVDAWNLGSMVPKFEPYVRNFWRVEHGLGSCGDTVKVGTVVKPTRGKTKTDVRFICAEVADETRWRIATDIEKDTYKWVTDTTDGAIKNGQVTGKAYVYDAEGIQTDNKKAGWRLATDIEKLYGGCRKELFSDYKRFIDSRNGRYYQCDETTHKWKLVQEFLPLDTKSWAPDEDGFAKWGDVIGVETDEKRICYVYDDAVGGYRAGTDNDCNLGLGGCTARISGNMFQSPKGGFYSCANNEWTQETNDIYVNTYRYRCTLDQTGENVYKEGDLAYGLYWTKSLFACDNGKWRTTTANEEQVKKACTSLLQGYVFGDTITCDNQIWRPTIFYDYAVGEKNWFNPDLEYGDLVDERDGRHYKTIKIGEQVWMAENLNYADSIASPYLKGQNRCYLNDSLNCLKGGRYYTWTAAMNIDPKWQGASPYAVDGLIGNPHRGICLEGWHIPTNDDWDTFKDNAGNYVALQAIGNLGWPNATNASGFTALPASAYFWSATEVTAGSTDGWYMNESDAYLFSYAGSSFSKGDGLSVRCLQDQN